MVDLIKNETVKKCRTLILTDIIPFSFRTINMLIVRFGIQIGYVT